MDFCISFAEFFTLVPVISQVWFLVFTSGLLKLQVSYEPSAIMAFSHKQWLCTFLHDLFQSLGSISLFSIFILILVFWADILKKYFEPGAKRNKPMATFQSLVICLILIEIANCSFFLWGFYSSEGMILANASLLAIVSIVCVWQITTFSNQFRTVLKTLGAINQVKSKCKVVANSKTLQMNFLYIDVACPLRCQLRAKLSVLFG
mmetsp:Transcript_29181/g.66952  ORF Transcript_29181/g.66952 Transcript_29181/m.66952 type:complete len:205 (-) Transcript_29181:814-1428(-)